MTGPNTFIRRTLAGAALALGVLTTAALSGPTAGADPPKPGGGRTATPTPVGGPLILPAPPNPVTTAAPATPLTFDRFEITEVGGTQATLNVRGSTPTIMHYTLRRVDGAEDGTASLPGGVYLGEHRVGLPKLQSNTTYEVAVYVINADGQQTTASKRFTTLKQRVRVTLREINITDDGDSWLTGDGEPSWLVGLEWAGGKTGGCYPNNGAFCETGSHGEGRFVPRNYLGQPLMWLFAEENFDSMPTAFTISASGTEYDIIPIGNLVNHIQNGGFASPPDTTPFEWQVPARQEWASSPATLDASRAAAGFRSTMAFTFELFHDNLSYPAARNAPQSSWGR